MLVMVMNSVGEMNTRDVNYRKTRQLQFRDANEPPTLIRRKDLIQMHTCAICVCVCIKTW